MLCLGKQDDSGACRTTGRQLPLSHVVSVAYLWSFLLSAWGRGESLFWATDFPLKLILRTTTTFGNTGRTRYVCLGVTDVLLQWQSSLGKRTPMVSLHGHQERQQYGFTCVRAPMRARSNGYEFIGVSLPTKLHDSLQVISGDQS